MVPKNISASILAFCHDISPTTKPEYIQFKQVAEPRAGFCVDRVKHIIGNEGGDLVLGWAIWEWPHVVLEAEYYAAWRKEGVLYDVTPRRGGKILFLTDPSAVNEEMYPISKMRALEKDDAIDKFIKYAVMLAELKLRYDTSKGPGEQSEDFNRDLEEIMKKMRRAKQLLIKKYPLSNLDRPCHCESGRSYRHCCALSILPPK